MVIAIMAVLAAIAAPSFNPLLQRWRVRNATEAMISTIYFARAEAIKRGGNVQITKTANNTDGCTQASTNADWGCGWSVYSVDASGTQSLLKAFSTPSRVQVSIENSNGVIQLDRWGVLTGVSAKGISFVPADGNTSSPAARGICLASGGRIKTIGNPPC